MAYQIRKVKYCYVTARSRAGEASKVLNELRKAKIDLLAFSGFPLRDGKAQLDLVTNGTAAVERVARKQGWRLSRVKRAFLVQGSDELGAVHKVLSRLAKKGINVIAADAVAAGKGRYGMILWVKPQNYNSAARILKAQ
jgi:hypothetical protein